MVLYRWEGIIIILIAGTQGTGCIHTDSRKIVVCEPSPALEVSHESHFSKVQTSPPLLMGALTCLNYSHNG